MHSKDQLHPIVKQLQPSPEQGLPVLSRAKRISVTAGAGTGKTRTLVAKYLSLLAEGIPLRSIVAITFTRKAAREMRNRIREEIRIFQLKNENADRQYWSGIYQELDAARISTIHSLAADILRQHPAELGLDPAFDLLEEGQAALLKSQAVEAALAWAADDHQAAILFTAIGTWQLRRILAELLEKRLDVEEAFHKQPENIWDFWLPILTEPIKKIIENHAVQAGLNDLAALETDGILAKADQAGDLLAADLQIVICEWKSILKARENQDWFDISRRIGLLRKHLKQKGKTANWEPANPKRIIKELQRHFEGMPDLSGLDLDTDYLLAEQILPALKKTFQVAEDWYQSRRQELNCLDFDDLEEKVLTLFREFPEPVRYWRDQVKYILVDEFQDTNERQRQFVQELRGPEGSLFIVGDGKQSIYRFRGADVSVFRDEQNRIKSTGFASELATSYRAHSELLAGLNHMLRPILGEETSTPFIEPFSPLEPGREEPPLIDLQAYIEFHLAAGTKSSGADAKAAEAVASRLLELVEPGSSDQRQMGFRFGDIAVLCRASSSFSVFEEAFDKAGIPFMTIAGQGFYDRPEVRDILNALRVFADPENDLAAAGLMRSPIVGIADDQIMHLRDYQRQHEIPSLYLAAKRIADADKGKYDVLLARFLDLVDEYQILTDRIPAGELMAKFINQTGYFASLAMVEDRRGVQNLKKLVADAQASGVIGLRQFLDTINDIKSAAIREGEAAVEAEGVVQIMTVHQAKGLEFPCVVLGDSSKRPPTGRNVLIDEQFGIVLPFSNSKIAPNSAGLPEIISTSSFAYSLALERERTLEEAESDRLLYVAATRAQDLLIISGVIGKPNQSGNLPKLGGWLGETFQALELQELDLELTLEGGSIHQFRENRPGFQVLLNIYEPEVAFLTGERYRARSKTTKIRDEIPAFQVLPVQTDRTRSFPWKERQIYPTVRRDPDAAYVPARIIGSIVHRALELWKFPSPDESDLIHWVEAQFQQRGIFDQGAVKYGYRQVRNILSRFHGSELFERMDAAKILLHEVPFTLLDQQGNQATGSIDALFLENENWILVEFKTDLIRSQNDYLRLWEEEDYQQQVQGYLHAAEKMLGVRPEPVLCFLNFQGQIKLETSRW